MTATETPPNRRREIVTDGSLGVFTVLSLVFLLFGGLWLRDNYHIHEPRYIRVYFPNAAQLTYRANVFLDGVRVGDVNRLQWESEHRVLAELKITNHTVKVPVGSHFCILNNGIVGAKYVEIILPELAPGEAQPAELANNATVEGDDPVRPELALNNLVLGLSHIDTEKLAKNFDADRARLTRAADQLARLADKSMALVDGALPLEHDLHTLTKETTDVEHRLNAVLGKPKFADDIKETVAMAKKTAETVKATVNQLNTTLKDKDLRGDLIKALDDLHSSTAELEHSVAMVQSISGDKQLRSDAKDILTKANEGLNTVDKIFTTPGYGNNLKQTIASTRDAVDHIDLVARQLNQILEKRSPLVHMLIGRPGLIKTIKSFKKDKNNTASGATGASTADQEAAKNVFAKQAQTDKTDSETSSP